MSRTTALIVAAVMIVLGLVAFPLQNLGKPEVKCAAEGAPSSGFVDDDSGCPITIESYNEIREFDSGPKWFRIGGIVLIVGGLGVGAYGLTRKRQRPDEAATPDAPAAG
jgi:hypothetical protein